MNLVTRLRGYGILTLVLVLFSGAIFLSFVKISNEQQEVARASEDNTIWTTTEAEVELCEVELYQLLDALHEYSVPESSLGHDELRQRFVILVNQLQRLHQGGIDAKLLEVQGAEATINNLLTRLQAIEQTVIALKKGDHPGVLTVSNGLRQFTGPLRALTLDVLDQAG
jgi:hypothetical protein